MAQVLEWFAARDVPGVGNINRVVVAGDWNLAATDGAFVTLAEAVEGLRAPIFEEKVVDFVLELAKVTEKSVTPAELTAAAG
jgi:hypothetical protein